MNELLDGIVHQLSLNPLIKIDECIAHGVAEDTGRLGIRDHNAMNEAQLAGPPRVGRHHIVFPR
ncbi:MAG: hypothetical protein R2834_21025 [Rhodothermales bacterium]